MDVMFPATNLWLVGDDTVAMTNTNDGTVMLLKPGMTKVNTREKDIKGRDILADKQIMTIYNPDEEDELYWLHRFGVIGDTELSTRMAQCPKTKRQALIAKLQQEVDNVPG